ncbi:MAG: ROK family transcriptional regulator [Pirellulales bacterium]
MERLKTNPNAARILGQIAQFSGISRVDIAKNLGLDKSTITPIMGRLLASGIVEETAQGQASSRGGRRPVELKINANYGCILGLDINCHGFQAVVLNLDGEAIYKESKNFSISGSTLAATVIEITNSINQKLSDQNHQLLGVGIGITGIVNYHEGVILYSDLFKIHEPLPLSELVSAEVDLPVYIENDANCCGWSELAAGKNKNVRNFLCVFLRYWDAADGVKRDAHYGLGLGIILDGKIYHGSNYAAGEFRSLYAENGTDTQFSVSDEDLKDIQNSKALSRISEELAQHINFLVHTLDLTNVVVIDTLRNQDTNMKSITLNAIQNQGLTHQDKISVVETSLGEEVVAYGAAGMVLVRIFNTSLINGNTKSRQPNGLSILIPDNSPVTVL